MQKIKRWTVGLFSGVDRVVGKIENQEAVVDAILRNVRKGTARAKVRLGAVQRDGQALRSRLDDARGNESSWTDRARRTAPENENRALECLRRARRARDEVGRLEQRLDEHSRVELRLKKEIATLEERGRELGERRNLMRSRSSRAEALRLARSLESGGLGDLDEVFERWEVRVTEAEIESGLDDPAISTDAFADAFRDQEEDSDLRHELAELLATGGDPDDLLLPPSSTSADPEENADATR